MNRSGNLISSRKLDSALVVSAPFNGVVLEQMATAGNRVVAADPLYSIASLKPLWLEIHVPLEQVADIHTGQLSSCRPQALQVQ